jgi:prefoldin subunit 5
MDWAFHMAVSQDIFVGTVVVLVIVIGVIGAVALYTNNQQQNNINGLNSSLTSLETNFNALNSQYVNLTSSYSNLQNSFNLLTANMSSLQSQYNSLYNNYASLNASYVSLNYAYTTLQSNYTNLLANYNSLLANYNSIFSNYTSLNSSYASLQQIYTYLQGNYTVLQNIVNFKNSTTLLTNGLFVIPRGGNQNITYSTPYAGYLSISFTATRGTLIEFSNSNYTGIYAQYPLIGNATSGTFKMPVFPGSETITIQDEPQISDISPLSVFVNVTYVY